MMRHSGAVLAALLAVAGRAEGPGGTGVIEGRVAYAGEAPPPTIVFEGGTTQQVLYLGAQHGLRYAVAFLADAAARRVVDPQPATLNQSSFIFQPQVLAVREGQPVRFTNEDGANHNVRSQDPEPANRFDVYTGAGQAHTRTFRADPAHRPVVVTCDTHPWMVAWIYVFDHPHFGLTDASGCFRIENVSPGVHRLAIRQPAGGLSRDVRIRVEPGRTTHVNVVFEPMDLARPARLRARPSRRVPGSTRSILGRCWRRPRDGPRAPAACSLGAQVEYRGRLVRHTGTVGTPQLQARVTKTMADPEADAEDERARQFEELALPHLRSLYRLAVRLTGGAPAAEDLVQETYLKALQAFPALREPARARSW